MLNVDFLVPAQTVYSAKTVDEKTYTLVSLCKKKKKGLKNSVLWNDILFFTWHGKISTLLSGNSWIQWKD